MEETSRELAALKAKEEVLEKKLLQLLGKMDMLKSGDSPASFAAPRAVERETLARDTRPVRPAAPVDEPMDDFEDEPRVETVQVRREAPVAEEDDIIIIDDDTASQDDDILVETVTEDEQRGLRGEGPADSQGDDDIILLDDEEDEIIIDDTGDEMIIIDDSDEPRRPSARSDERGRRTASDEDDDFLIIEEDQR
jgi:hypothetical protein